jgi:hypothetical protein
MIAEADNIPSGHTVEVIEKSAGRVVACRTVTPDAAEHQRLSGTPRALHRRSSNIEGGRR